MCRIEWDRLEFSFPSKSVQHRHDPTSILRLLADGAPEREYRKRRGSSQVGGQRSLPSRYTSILVFVYACDRLYLSSYMPAAVFQYL